MDRILLARLAILPFAVLEWGIVSMCVFFRDLFPKYALKGLVPWAIQLVLVPGIAFAQLYIYRSTAQVVGRLTDSFVYAVLIFENGLGLVLFFYLLSKRRTKDRALGRG
jgi:hypothetical protein